MIVLLYSSHIQKLALSGIYQRTSHHDYQKLCSICVHVFWTKVENSEYGNPFLTDFLAGHENIWFRKFLMYLSKAVESLYSVT